MGSYNESSIGNKYFFEILWGVPKKLYLEKFYFKGRDVFELNGHRQFPENPVYLYPHEDTNFLTDSAVSALGQFYETGSIFPRCSIKAEVKAGKQIEIITYFQFQNVRILEQYGKDWKRDRYNSFYKVEFDRWFFE